MTQTGVNPASEFSALQWLHAASDQLQLKIAEMGTRKTPLSLSHSVEPSETGVHFSPACSWQYSCLTVAASSN